VLASFISPYRDMRARVRQEVTNFIEVYVSAPVEVCAQRDVKGLYARAFAGEIPNFTGVSAPYEPPETPEIVLPTHELSVEECVAIVLKYLEERELVPRAEPPALPSVAPGVQW